MRLNSLYECGCAKCKAERQINLAAGDKNPLFKNVLNAAKNAFKHLFSSGGYKPEDLNQPAYKKLIDETYKVFQKTITDNDMPDIMRRALEEDVFLFGGLRTHAQLTEAWSLIKDNRRKTFDELSKELDDLNDTYNKNYLQAEYNFATGSAQMAAKWANLDDSERYLLQYRTAMDDRVRDSHATLAGTTLPKNDPFWKEYYPPNGWNCRCTVVEVLKDDYPESDSDEAIAKGEASTQQIGKDGKNRLEIFRFNPGMEMKVMPPSHPYNKVKGANEVKEIAEETVKADSQSFKDLSLEELQETYKNQTIDQLNESIIMGEEKGYVATGNSFRLNEKLRYGYSFEGDDKATLDALDSLIKNNVLKENIRLHRYVDDDFIGDKFGVMTWGKSASEIIERMKSANITHFEDAGFSSASAIEKNNAFRHRKVEIKINAKKGTNAFVTNNISESEVILGRNQRFKIIDYFEIENDRIRILVETD